MAKLSKEQLCKYDHQMLQAMATDIAREVFGESTVKRAGTLNDQQLIQFILDNQEG